MERFTRVAGIGVPLMLANIDTDTITPGKELIRIMSGADSSAYADALFSNLRYLDDARTPNPEFILNQEPWARAVLLIADHNFGCGSSRETAPRALRSYGFRAVIAPSFGAIFYANSFRNGLLPVELPAEHVHELARQMHDSRGGAQIAVDLEYETVIAPDGQSFHFHSPRLLRQMLLEGQDEIGVTLGRLSRIEAFRVKDRAKRPWAYPRT